MTLTYKGRDVETLTREELLEAVHAFHLALERERQFSRDVIEMEQLFAQAKEQISGKTA